MTSLGDDARETLKIAGLEKAKERALEQHLRLRAPQTWTVLCASVDSVLANDGGLEQSARANGNWGLCCQRVPVVAKAGHEKARCRFRNAKCSKWRQDPSISDRCADNVRNLLASQVPRAAVARVLAKAAGAVETQTSAIVVDRSVIDDLIAPVENENCSL